MKRALLLATALLLACPQRTDRPPRTGGDSIGAASMAADGTITMTLRAEDGRGSIGDAQFVYAPSHPRYEQIRRHLPTLQPGGSVQVPP
ncbi:MAG: hypothetical protein HY909_15405 [Deltaproteobacteria bacterium]|nr:hypothetical protein [Deltaproteobacteria bacterium]